MVTIGGLLLWVFLDAATVAGALWLVAAQGDWR